MRYALYLLTLALVFTGGMLVGNFYVPDHSTSLSTAVSVPDAAVDEALISLITPEQTQLTLEMLTQALSSCQVVVKEEQEKMFNQISLFLAVQDFRLKKAIYEAELAKNISENRPTPQFEKAAADYAAAKTKADELTAQLFPPKEEPQENTPDTAADETATAQVPTTDARDVPQPPAAAN